MNQSTQPTSLPSGRGGVPDPAPSRPVTHTVTESTRPMSCSPTTHKDGSYRMTVSDAGVVTTYFECGTCGATWTEKKWRA